jgi:peroxiredoxin
MKSFNLPTIILLVIAAFCLQNWLPTPTAPSGYIVGDTAEDFSLKNVDGNFVSLSQYKDVKGLLVIFTCNHCPYAQLYEQRIIDLHKMYAPLGIPVVAINPNSPLIVPEDSYEEMQKRAKAKKYPFAYLFDEEQVVLPKFGATRTPHVFLLDSAHVVRYIGAIDDNPESPASAKNRWVDNAVNALLAGEKPNPDFTRALGCTVKKKPH